VACAAAHAVLDVIEEEKLCDRANVIGKIILDRCNQLKSRSNLNCIGDVRGLGAMCAVELVKDAASAEPAPQLTQALMKVANEKGLFFFPAALTATPSASSCRSPRAMIWFAAAWTYSRRVSPKP
jgi:4-aminobutyrate aminotransferase-like enzyme